MIGRRLWRAGILLGEIVAVAHEPTFGWSILVLLDGGLSDVRLSDDLFVEDADG